VKALLGGETVPLSERDISWRKWEMGSWLEVMTELRQARCCPLAKVELLAAFCRVLVMTSSVFCTFSGSFSAFSNVKPR
jgi:hypothetical protein